MTAHRRFEAMLRARLTDEASAQLWDRGRISGELHTSRGEEAVVVGVVDHLDGRDGVASDHRSTAPFVARGVPVGELLAEMLGLPDGLCGGHGGHMHFADRERLVVADGIVGSSAPTASGFALKAQQDGDGGVAVAFFGEGATNQGMLLESLNLAVVWRLPVVFVCKRSGLAITTTNRESFGASLLRRARGFGMPAVSMSGHDVERVWRTSSRAVRRARGGGGPTFLMAPVHRPDGHFLGDPLLRIRRDPTGQAQMIAPSLLESLTAPGAAPVDRLRSLSRVVRSVTTSVLESARSRHDPLMHSRARLSERAAEAIEERVAREVSEAVEAVAQDA
jgi:pyruvate dehydrogenase E1 component alpha subunit